MRLGRGWGGQEGPGAHKHSLDFSVKANGAAVWKRNCRIQRVEEVTLVSKLGQRFRQDTAGVSTA